MTVNLRTLLFLCSCFVFLVSCSQEPDVVPRAVPALPGDSQAPEAESTPPVAENSGGATETPPQPNPADYHVLFVGNSLTYRNDLPGLFRAVAMDAGKRVATEMLAFPDYGLIDHWYDGKVQEKIASGVFDYVVIQQGPSSQQEGRESLIYYGGLLNSLCEENGAQLAYYMVWPARAYYYTFGGVIENYRYAAALHSTLLCPVGERWKEHFDGTGDFSYYGPDNFHPSEAGSKVAATIIYYSLFSAERPQGN